MLHERRAHATEVAIPVLGHDPRRAKFQKMIYFRSACEHFVNGEEHLLGIQLWPEKAQILDGAGSFRTPGGQHSLPVCPRHALWWTNLFSGKRCLDGCDEFHWPFSSSAALLVWHEVQVKCRKIGARRQAGNLFLLRLANDVAMVTNQAAQGRLPKHLGLVGLPPEQVSDGSKREFLR